MIPERSRDIEDCSNLWWINCVICVHLNVALVSKINYFKNIKKLDQPKTWTALYATKWNK